MQTQEITPEVASKQALVVIGDMPLSAKEIYDYVRDALVAKATPLKEVSLDLHRQVIEALPAKWEEWDITDVSLAGTLHDSIFEHIKEVSYKSKPTELDTISDKAHKLHKGIIAAITDVLGEIPTDKDSLAKKIRAWRDRQDAADKAEAARLQAIADKQAEDKRLAEALALEEEAARLKAMGHEELAAEVKKEAEAVIEEKAFVPPVTVQSNVPKSGPSKRRYPHIKVTSAMAIIKAVAAGTMPQEAVTINESFLLNQYKNARTIFQKYPGCEGWED
jgi:hypothetical protein